MILKRRTMLFSLLPLFIFGCSTDEEGTGIPSIGISESNIVDISEAITSIEFIPLKNQLDSPVNLNCSVWDLKVTGEYFVYSTICNPEAKIHLFDLKGNYVKTFGKAGSGPEEYQNLQGVDLAEDTLSISVGAGVIKQYSFPEFEFAGTVTLDENAVFMPTFAKITENKWLTSAMFDGNVDENGEFRIFKIQDSSNGEITELPITATPITNEISEGEFFQLRDNSYLLNYAFSDTLYLLENGETSPLLSLDFGSREPSAEDVRMDGEKFEAAITTQPFVINMGKIWHTAGISRIKTFALAKNPDMDISNMRTFPVHEVFIDHESGNAIAFPSLAGWSNGKGFAKDGFFYDILRAEDWIYVLEKGSLGKHGEKLEQILNELEAFEDPVLIKYKVKF